MVLSSLGTFLFALLCLLIVFCLIEFALWVFISWIVFGIISFVLSLFGLQQYAWLVFVLFIVWSWFRRY